jgi:hypothetical protein
MSALTAFQLYIITVELSFLGLGAVTQHPDWFDVPESGTGSIHSEWREFITLLGGAAVASPLANLCETHGL